MANPLTPAQAPQTSEKTKQPKPGKTARIHTVSQRIVEIVSDSGEGAQTAGQLFGSVCAKAGNGVWTVEIIPAEIEPPSRSRAGASGNRIRFSSQKTRNMGDKADVVVAFNDQVVYGRIDDEAMGPGTILIIDRKWRNHADENIRKAYIESLEDFEKRGYDVREVPIEAETLRFTENPQRGKNMWALGLLCALFSRDIEHARTQVRAKFKRKAKVKGRADAIIETNLKLLDSGYEFGLDFFDERYEIPAVPWKEPRVVMDGNAAIALGTVAAGIEVCSMYPITPATSATHYLAAMFHKAGGFIHQAEDEIAAIGFAIGASYAGKTPITITSGPGIALKTEFIGLAVMAEIPLVIVDVQRGGPATGLPTKVEQGDLLAALYGQPGDAPKVVMAASSIGECFHFVITARKIAESLRMPVIVLTDANLATGQSDFPLPQFDEDWLSPPIDQSPWEEGVSPYAWDPETGVSRRPIPGQPGGMHVLTGLAHDENSRVAYESKINQQGMRMRSRKVAAFASTLKPPKIYGDEEGDLLVVGWGATRGTIEEAVDRLRADDEKASAVHLRFLSPMEPGLKDIFSRFKKVITVEVNYSDDLDDPFINEENRRYGQLARLLRSQTLVDIDCWTRVPGKPLAPGLVEEALRKKLAVMKGEE